ncbi:hypothetical protein PG997_014925 [Apiospora hydei]|uniref:Uncharacterized protein n=1 Tax=Apiospora hydei TaxID=1337664 RepID=A0ABR1UV86_9PEZI
MERTATRPKIEITATRPIVEIRNDSSSSSKLPQRPKYASRGSSGASSQRSSQTDLSSQSGYTTSSQANYAPSSPANYGPSSPANYAPSNPVNYAPQTPTQAPFGSTRSLADRFSRVPRPEQPQPQPLQSLQQLQQSQQHQAGPPSLPSPRDAGFYNFDTDTESGSASSVLSVSTQATSVASSDITTSSKETRAPASKQGPYGAAQDTGSAIPSQDSAPSATIATAASRPAQKSGRTVHIQVMPPPAAPAPAPPSKDLQLQGRKLGSSPSRANLNEKNNSNNTNAHKEKDLLHKIGQLEREAQDLQASNSRLNRELTDTREQLSTHGYNHKEAERSINQERMARELAARDLQEQRQRCDEYRSDFELQRGMLQAAEAERDAMRRGSAETRMELVRLTQDLEQRSQMQRDQEDLLLRQIAAFEHAAVSLESRIAAQGKEVKHLTAERDALKSDVEKYATEAKAFAEEKKTFVDAQAASKAEMEAMKAEQEKLQCRIKEVEGQNIDLQGEIENLEQKIGNLQTQIDAFSPEKEELTKRLTDEKEALAKELDHEMDELEKDLHHEMDQLEKKLKEEKNAIENKLLAEKAVMERRLLEDKEAIEKQLTDEKWDVQTRLEDEKAAIQKQLEEEKATIQTQLEEEKVTLQNRLDVEVAAKAAQIEKLETDIAGSKMANIALADEKLVLDKKLTEARDHFNEATENLAKLQGEIAVFQANIQSLEADKEQAAKNLDAAREEHTKGLELAKEEHSKNLEAAKEGHAQDLEAAYAKQAELELKAKALEADIQGLDPENLVAKNRELVVEKALLEARLTALRGELDERIPVLQAEAEKVPSLAAEACQVPALAEQNCQLASQISTLMRELDEARTIHAIVAMKAHELELRLKAESKPRRSNGSSSRSSSRSSSKDGSHSDKKSSSGSSSSGSSSSSRKHGRSSSSSGMVFVRNTGDRAGTVCIMRREEL